MRPLRVFAGAGLLALCCLQLLALLRAPAAWMPAEVGIVLGRGDSMQIGRDALGAPEGDAAPFLLRRDAGGDWWIGATDGAAPPALERDGVRRRGGSVTLATGQRLRVGAATFAIESGGADAVGFSSATMPPVAPAAPAAALPYGTPLDAGRMDGAPQDAASAASPVVPARAGGAPAAVHWRYDGATLWRDGAVQPACPDTRAGARLAAAWNRVAPAALTLARPLVFGGNLDCGNRIALPGLAAPAASFARSADGIAASAGGAGVQAPPLMVEAGIETALAERALRLQAGDILLAGRTRLLVRPDGGLLRLRPASHVALYAEPQRRLPPGVTWSWQRRALWNPAPALAAVMAGSAGVLLAGFCAWRRQKRGRPRAARTDGRAVFQLLAGALLALAGLLLLWLQRSGAAAGAGVALPVAWAALWLALWAPRRLPLALAAALLLLATGLLAQLELGLAGPDSSWLRYVQKSAALLAVGLGGGAGWQGWRGWRMQHGSAAPRQARVEALLMLLAALALAALLLQVAFGDETGVFDLQPVEFAKLALTALSAHCLALAAGAQPAPGGALRQCLRLVFPALLFAVLLAVALVQVDDYSPLVLLGVWGGALALAYALATGQRLAAAALLGCACLAVLGIVGLRGAGPAALAQWNFYADRFLVWLDPGTHPHTGQQLLLGARAVMEGGWRGADGLFGLATATRGGEAALRIPAVQDDFAASFFLNRHGLAAALALWLLQAAFVAGLLAIALRCWLAQRHARDFRLAWLARLRCFVLCGGAAFVCGHFLLSWGTNLAIFPVMGQPMSFLSAGGSHLLFFICPLLAFAAASAQSLEENQPCPAASHSAATPPGPHPAPACTPSPALHPALRQPTSSARS
ncbi:FtsW/RodA/SpoVE family cell cycle protein [Massilia forsythiae]|uniref:Probable peptidoglycan glycosyltransferase FtsW n=1 Tax=Massilia forsythiae TaxID=2728020 RepID=A0A7Z2W0S6_9BURK|nr:FtsW/RodA/SpoVE family cell cycle protein [Massilia forsythiae]QJE02673.1 FtsW/RodA/SpoVE family cell cycle protein [Massilia forsythiae]